MSKLTDRIQDGQKKKTNKTIKKPMNSDKWNILKNAWYDEGNIGCMRHEHVINEKDDM